MNGTYALLGTSAIIRHVQHLVYKVAENQSAVLITGESGTGKELVARIIHDRSPRNGQPFVTVKCPHKTEESLETELFGQQDGAGQISRLGSFIQAQGGSLHIEEVSQLSPRLQERLLRALQDGVVRPTGATADVHFGAMVIFSSSMELEQLVRAGQFREDLYYKLSCASIYLPPLRERREDIPILCEFFVQKYNQLKAKKISGISHDAINALLQNSWKNNLSELENLIERIVVLKNSGRIDICDLPPKLRSLVTNNIDHFYDKNIEAPNSQGNHYSQNQIPNFQKNGFDNRLSGKNPSFGIQSNFLPSHPNQSYGNSFPKNTAGVTSPAMVFSGLSSSQNHNPLQGQPNSLKNIKSVFDDGQSEVDQFMKKEIDLGSGIDFYRVVEEFENKLISEALRRTNHNKNRAAQLLSMNRTTLVEKLKKRATSTNFKVDGTKVKRNAAFTIFDGLGEIGEFESMDFLNVSADDVPPGG